MSRERLKRYNLAGTEGERAIEAGLVDGDWFRSEVPRKRMKELMRRSDWPALRDTALWVGGMVLSAALGTYFWGSWLAIPCFIVYGVLYGSASDPRRHETQHGTAFKTRWLNEAVHQFSAFLTMREPVVWRWQHTRHHTDTLIVGRDAEIQVMRPARLAVLLANFFGLVEVPLRLRLMVIHATGRLTADEATYVPDDERSKVYWTARIWVAIYGATIAACFVFSSILPVLLIGGPRIYGVWLDFFFAPTQHAGLGENVLDHRLNTRTVYMSPINRFIYWNMGYHVEHHMYPMVPYHRLPDLHEEIKHDLAPAYPSMWAAWKEIVPAVLRQLKDPTYYVRRELPPGATPFHPKSDGRAL